MYRDDVELCYRHSLHEVTPKNAAGYFRAAGYIVPSAEAAAEEEEEDRAFLAGLWKK